MNTQKQLVLASQSPRRKAILKQIGINFTVHSTDFEERDEHLSAEGLVAHNSLGKAQKAARHYKNALIIGVDTVGAFRDKIINKPKSEEQAKDMLRLLSNTTHRVVTGITIIDTSNPEKALTETETTYVTFDRLDEEAIEAYISSGEGQDKAAGYAIQGLGSLFVKKIEGDYFNVVGLPVYRLRKMLRKFGIKLELI